MKRFHSALLLASVASMALASGASAQTVPTPGPNDGVSRLNGAGATAVQEIVAQEQECLDISLPSSVCPAPIVSPLASGFASEYLATGSGAGRQAWRNRTPQLVAQGRPWKIVQFAFSESTTSATELGQYNTNVLPYGGNPIVVPKFVLPVAISYNPVYARNTATSTDYRFNVNATFPTSTTQIGGVNVGGLRMTRPVLCGIFNGTITNWNDTALTNANGTLSLGDPADTSFSTLGAPIRLVGRMDRSGTTDIFTRALAAQCGGTNRYLNNAEALPYDRGGPVPDFSGIRADTPYATGSTAPLAGTFNLIGNQYFNGTTIAAVAGGSSSNPAAGSSTGSGLFLLADGSSRVAGAIAAAPDFGTTRVYNGKVGYIGADFIANAITGNPNLFAAALSRPSAPTVFRLPSAPEATLAFGSIVPPQSDSSGTNTGAFQLTDTRSVRNPAGGANIQARRINRKRKDLPTFS